MTIRYYQCYHSILAYKKINTHLLIKILLWNYNYTTISHQYYIAKEQCK